MLTAIRAITDSNKKEVLDLKIAGQPHGFIEPVSHCLADAEKDTRYVPLDLSESWGIISFSMYGKVDVQIWLERYPNQLIYVSLFEQTKVAIQLYQKFVFSFTKELDENGEKIMIYPNGGL